MKTKMINKILAIAEVLSILAVSNVFAQSEALKISIAVASRDAKNATEYQNHWINLYREDTHFHVVITNISNEPKRLWETWNSWGWYNLTFEILDNQGKILHILKKKSHGWSKNYPSFIRLQAGEYFIIDVNLERSDWGLPFLDKEKEGNFEINLKAIYEIPEDKETKEHNIWTGKIESEIGEYTLSYYKNN